MKEHFNYLTSLLFFAIVIHGCASNGQDNKPQQQAKDTLSNIKKSLEKSRNSELTQSDKNASKELPKSVQDALLPSYRYRVSNRNVSSAGQERFDIAVDRMPARAFFMGLVKDTPINIVVHPEARGKITLDLKNVTIDEVLEVTRDIYGYEFEKNRAGYLILASRLQSRVFHVNYLNIKRKGESNTRVTSGQIGDTNSLRGAGNLAAGGLAESNQTGGDGSNRAFASSRIETNSEADFWNDLQETISIIIGSGKGRSVVVSSQASLVVVRAMPGELRDVERFLSSAQLNMHRQVILEAKIIEVQLNANHQSGINWTILDDSNSDSTLGGQLQIMDGNSELIDESGQALRSGLVSTDNLPGFGSLFTVGGTIDNFGVIIRLLNQQGEVNVLSSPRVSTVNNQKAVIKVGSDEFFVTEVSSTTTTGTATTTTPQITLTPFFSGIALDVTPQIDENDEVILHIHPTISEVKDQTKDITVGGQTQSLPLAFSTVRESDSIVRAKNGQIVVIGGLMQDQTIENRGNVPGLHKIPVLGELFKQKQKIATRSELVILLRPIVVDVNNDIWNKELENVSRRIDSFSK